jgi:ribonucrease Y
MFPYIVAIAVLAGIGAGYGVRVFVARFQKKSLEHDVQEIMLKARTEAQKVVSEAEIRAEKILTQSRELEQSREKEFSKTKEHLERREQTLDKRQSDLDQTYEDLKGKIDEVRAVKEKAEQVLQSRTVALEKIAGLSRDEARDILIQEIEVIHTADLQSRMQKLELFGIEKIKERARTILATSINRLASSTASEFTTTTVKIESEDVKGQIIGKEGRNIRTFERVAGVELIIDDSPTEITISSFDPIRRQIAKVALENLLADGRMQPAKIEEFIEKAQSEINEIVKKKGEEAVYECGIFNIDPRVVAILGRLHFRTSYGQNVLKHSLEVAHLCEMIASEIGADPYIAKFAGLVHDIGKALDHEFEGTHVEIGMKILQKFGVDERVIIGMRSHHDEYPHESLEGIIVQTADMISGSRPGARRDTLENYLKRLRELEAVANTFQGVMKSYALQAGREIRVFVHPEQLNDLQAKRIAREIAIKIERDLRYPGEVKITLIRENRVVEYAR